MKRGREPLHYTVRQSSDSVIDRATRTRPSHTRHFQGLVHAFACLPLRGHCSHHPVFGAAEPEQSRFGAAEQTCLTVPSATMHGARVGPAITNPSCHVLHPT